MASQPCTFDGWQQAGAPQVWLAQGLAEDRDQARQQARAALRACLAPALGCDADALQVTNVRGQAPRLLMRGRPLPQSHCSISHAPGLALLAWRREGPVGVDIQALDGFAPRRELEAVAHLFLAQETARMLMDAAPDALFFEKFTQAWTLHEARLKCAGLNLVEWSERLPARLAQMRSAAVLLARGYAGAVAWR